MSAESIELHGTFLVMTIVLLLKVSSFLKIEHRLLNPNAHIVKIHPIPLVGQKDEGNG